MMLSRQQCNAFLCSVVILPTGAWHEHWIVLFIFARKGLRSLNRQAGVLWAQDAAAVFMSCAWRHDDCVLSIQTRAQLQASYSTRQRP